MTFLREKKKEKEKLREKERNISEEEHVLIWWMTQSLVLLLSNFEFLSSIEQACQNFHRYTFLLHSLWSPSSWIVSLNFFSSSFALNFFFLLFPSLFFSHSQLFFLLLSITDASILGLENVVWWRSRSMILQFFYRFSTPFLVLWYMLILWTQCNRKAIFWVERNYFLWLIQTLIAILCFSEAVLLQYLTYKVSFSFFNSFLFLSSLSSIFFLSSISPLLFSFPIFEGEKNTFKLSTFTLDLFQVFRYVSSITWFLLLLFFSFLLFLFLHSTFWSFDSPCNQSKWSYNFLKIWFVTGIEIYYKKSSTFSVIIFSILSFFIPLSFFHFSASRFFSFILSFYFHGSKILKHISVLPLQNFFHFRIFSKYWELFTHKNVLLFSREISTL